MNLVPWNCRGLGGKQKLEEFKRIKQSESMSILTIQETKMQSGNCIEAMKNIWKTGNGSDVRSHGASGGIVTWWDTDSFKLISKSEK